MAKLILRNKFTVEVPKQDGTFDIIEGSLRTITKQEQRELEEFFKEGTDLAKKLSKDNTKLNKIQIKLERLTRIDFNQEILAKMEELENQFETIEQDAQNSLNRLTELDTENKAIQKKMNMLLDDGSKSAILNLSETYGYKLVWDTIQDGIDEGKLKELKN